MTPLRATAAKLAAAMFAMPLSLVLAALLSEWFAVGFPVALVMTILYWIDLGQALRDADDAGRAARVAGILMGVPQALLGVACVVAGLAIIAWVLYNTFVERLPHYSGGLLPAFGVAPGLVLFGAGWLWFAFRRRPPTP